MLVQPVNAQDCKASLLIKSDIENVLIFINDSLRSSSNNYETEIEKGYHVVSIIENTKRWNAKTFTDTMVIDDCSDLVLNHTFRSEILLDTDPQDVYVFENDSLIGFTPLYLSDDFGDLHLQKPGYLSRNINRDDLLHSSKLNLEFIGEEKGTSFFEKPLFKILVGTALALGATTAYFKLEADNKFEEYELTGNPDLLDKTDTYDIISGITFVGLQINFGLIIYLFLTD